MNKTLNGSTLKLETTLVDSAWATSTISTTSARYSTGKAAKLRNNMISSVVCCYNCWCCKVSLQSQLTRFAHLRLIQDTYADTAPIALYASLFKTTTLHAQVLETDHCRLLTEWHRLAGKYSTSLTTRCSKYQTQS